MLVLDALCWWLAIRLTKHPALRWVISIFVATQILGLAWIIVGRIYRTGFNLAIPKFVFAAVFIWHFIGLGLFVFICAIGLLIWPVTKIVGRIKRREVAS